MLRNYLKVALKVFWRHKFFTAVNLFGICFTLVVLMVAAAFIDQQVGPIPPEVHASRTLHLGWLFVERGTDDEHFLGTHKPSYAFLDRYVRPLETAENVTVFSEHNYWGLQGGAEEVRANVTTTDAAFWEVFGFDFRRGRPYTAAEVEAGDRVAVIRAGFSRRVFGSEAVESREVPIDGRSYRVVGVVADFSTMRTAGDIWVPLTSVPSEEWRTYKLDGEFNAAVLARRPGDVEPIRAELAAVLAQVEPPPGEDRFLRGVSAPLLTTLEEWARANNPGTGGRTTPRAMSTRPPSPGFGNGCSPWPAVPCCSCSCPPSTSSTSTWAASRSAPPRSACASPSEPRPAPWLASSSPRTCCSPWWGRRSACL